ncbi:MAG: hypothetical protein LC687_07595, partial [Actinobacteria bacterium]|nr:hypothetical protein [Actinomycetota bacterium]
MNLNRNESVASGNIVTNLINIAATNLNGAAADASLTGASVNAENVLSSYQLITENISATTTSNVFNEDQSTGGEAQILLGSVEQSGNVSIAQATGNQTGTSGNSLTLGDAGTSNSDRTGALTNAQSATGADGTIMAEVNQSVRVELDRTPTTGAPVQQSSIVQDGNVTSALARSNAATNTVTVDGGNIDSGTDDDALFNETSSQLTGAQVLVSSQDNQFEVIATIAQSEVLLSSINSEGTAIANSTVSQSTRVAESGDLIGNSSTATALANSVVNTISSGGGSSNVEATAALTNVQDNSGAVTAAGGSAVRVLAIGNGVDNPSGITGSSVDISGNTSVSNAVGNRAQNTLSASGANITSGDPTANSGNAILNASGSVG